MRLSAAGESAVNSLWSLLSPQTNRLSLSSHFGLPVMQQLLLAPAAMFLTALSMSLPMMVGLLEASDELGLFPNCPWLFEPCD